MIKFSVSARQDPATIKKADEIRVLYKDYRYVFDLIKKYKDKPIVIKIPANVIDVDWETLKSYVEMEGNITLALEDLHMMTFAQETGAKYYWAYPITTWFELRNISSLGVSQVLIGAPLYFNLPKVKEKGKPIRIVANNARGGELGAGNNICGPYVRPEDLKTYEPYVDTIEFYADTLESEKQLFDIYKKGEWEGNLFFLIKNLNYNVNNRIIPEEFGEFRLHCDQRCMQHKTCHYCETAFSMANAARDMILDGKY